MFGTQNLAGLEAEPRLDGEERESHLTAALQPPSHKANGKTAAPCPASWTASPTLCLLLAFISLSVCGGYYYE